MTGLELALAIAGVVITIMVVAGMFLIVPSGVEAAPVHRADPVPPDPERGRDRAGGAAGGGRPDAEGHTATA